MEEPNLVSGAMADEDYDSEVEAKKVPKFVVKVNYEAKLKELLHRINSVEIKLCSAATKEFIKLLKGDSGAELLRLYVTSSSRCSELLGAWKLRQGKPGISCVFKLISVVLNHADGRYRPDDKNGIAVSRVLDKFARSIIEEHLQDVYKEINSREVKSQNAALLLMASIVRRGSVLASDVAKSFDFKLKGFASLAAYKKRLNEKRAKRSSRKAFVWFAVSFLEVGKPGLLRWVLQQKEMYSGVLRALGNEDDDDETVVHVLSTLRDRVLVEESLVPPGLRSVLFGSATLEQLVEISGRENGGYAAELAYGVLVLLCTDPCNGLMPDPLRRPSPLRGNPRRLLGLMKKLKATEVVYHRDLLLAIVCGRPTFGAAYMEEFPYNLEDFALPNWFAIVTLAANLLSSVGKGLNFDSIGSEAHESQSSNSVSVESLTKCLFPRSFSQSVITRGLLHSDFLVKHGTLRLLLEALKLLDPLIGALNNRISSPSYMSLKQQIQNEVRTSLPDPQVLVTLLSSLNSQSKTRDGGLKRKKEPENSTERGRGTGKRLKKEKLDDKDTDIVIGGISDSMDIAVDEDSEKVGSTNEADDFDSGKDIENVLYEIWGSCATSHLIAKEAEIYFQSKLLEALKTYFKLMPTELEKLFMFLTKLLNDPLALHSNLQQSLLSYLVEYVGWSSTGIPVSVPPMMYRHLKSFIKLLIFSPISDVKSKAYDLARAAMSSTGAFDRNHHEIESWFLFLPGYDRRQSSSHVQGLELFQSCQVVISFFCDAISTVGNSLFKYWDIVKSHTCNLNCLKDASPGFSPLVVCILQKCLRLLDSKSETGLPEKSMISLYVGNTLKYISQTQVDARLLSSVIDSILSDRLGETNSIYDHSETTSCEWRPLKNLLLFSRSILDSQTCVFSTNKNAISDGGSFALALSQVERSPGGDHDGEKIAEIINSFSSSLICAMPKEIIENFPSVMTTSQKLPVVLPYLMPSIFFLQQRLLTGVSNSWPEVFFAGLEMAVCRTSSEERKDDALVATNEAASATAIFSLFLKETPFHVLFPSIMSIDSPYSSEPMKMKDLLLAKLSEWKFDNSHLSYLSLLLFWIHQIQSSYRVSPSAKLQELSEICFILLKDLLVQLFESKTRVDCPRTVRGFLSTQDIQEAVETIFCHPVVVTSISHPLGCDMGLAKANLVDDLEKLINSRQGIHKLDQHIWDILGTTTEFLFSLCDDPCFKAKAENGAAKKLVKVFNLLMQRVFKEVKEKFKEGVRSGDLMLLLPPYHALQAVIRFLTPFELLELVKWLFKEVKIDELTVQESSKMSAVSFGIFIAIGAFRNLCSYLMQPLPKRRKYDLFWKIEEIKDFNIVEEIYIQMTRLALHFEIDYVNACLLEAVSAAQRQKYTQHHNFHRLSLVMSGIVSKTSVEMLSHCIHKTTKTKAKLLFLFTDMSSLHLSMFGDLFLGIVNNDLLHRGKMVEENSHTILSDKDYMMLLPAALLYLNSTFTKFGMKYYKNFKSIASCYSVIIMKGFTQWNSFVSDEMFEEEYGNILPSSSQELFNLVNDSLLGKTVRMLQHHFAFERDSMKVKKRLKLFVSIFPISGAHDELMDCDFSAVDSFSLEQSLNLMNRLVAKISFCRMLLFPNCYQIQSVPNEDGVLEDTPLQKRSTKEECSQIHFVKVLVGIWQLIVKKFPSVSDNFEKCPAIFSLYRYLEDFILRIILELTTELRGILVQQETIPFLEQLTKSALRYRYEDPTTLKALQSILTVLSEGKFARDFYIQLLLAHSQFESTVGSVSISTRCWGIGAFLKPMPGILRYLVFRTADENLSTRHSHLYSKQLGVIKLLRTLFSFKSDQSALDFGKSLGIKFRKLHLLLLSSYGATLGALDLEIYNLLSAIESIDGVEAENIAGFDYLWGNAASKIEKEQALERNTANILDDAEAVKERRRCQFRDNLPIDPKICASTVLYFPYDRTASSESVSFDKFLSKNFASTLETQSSAVEDPERYDPVFILRFSLYCLSAGYLEPLEFAGLGLLAVAFVSLSSPDEGIRRVAYSTLEKFKNALEQCKKKKKDITHIRLLLTSLQNGIEEPWQRIPSVVAVFAAEASFILLDSSHDHYATLSRNLMNPSKMNMKNVPMFNDFFWSVSVNFKAERLWILRLLYVGLNLDDDAQIYIRNSILETIMTFYFSPLSDNESNHLILQVVKQSIKSYKLTRHLVENCGLFSWLSSVLLISNKKSSTEEKKFSIMQLTLVLEIVNDVISLRNVNEWLQKEALEQLTELASHLYRFLVDGVVMVKEHARLVDFILEIIASTLKLSHKRKIYQPHFNISIDGLYQLCEVVSDDDNSVTCTSTSEFGLKAILMSIPPYAILGMGQKKLQTFLVWAISSALRAESAKSLQNKALQDCLSITSGAEQHEESLVSKLLRWLTASVILGSLATRSNGSDQKMSSSLKDLLSSLVHVETACGDISRDRVGCEEVLASAILFLHRIVATNYNVLPSVVSALIILLHNASSCSDGLHSHEFRSVLESLWSKVRCTAEANPAWRWAYYQPWKDLSLEQTDSQKIDEIHACQQLLFVMSNVLGSNGSQSLTSLTEDIQKITAFEWEKRILIDECNNE